jgi:uncharacterized protein (DUF1778 family)
MTAPLKDRRIELRVTSAQKAAIEEAAALQGRSVTDFAAEALTARADEVIQRDRQLRVDAIRFDTFIEVLDRPAQNLDGLRALLTRGSVFVD